MATTQTSTETESNTATIVEEVKEETQEAETLRLREPKEPKQIKWAEGTVDNEGMGKRTSKCCCIYQKPRMFGESSSEEDSEDENQDKCKAPKAYHKKSKKAHDHQHDDCNACP